ncbi:MAG: hypothetical protein GYA88_02715 [Clostridiales bacterium]|jgi:predicted DNA-binding protein YlxM (UPF0122 family)|nr:hypothetical protein [Clostridiales bacterium]
MDIVERARLFDFYSGLLSDKQREYYDLYYNEDFSLAEIAEKFGFSRQGIWDALGRAENTLSEAERSLGFISFMEGLANELAGIGRELEEMNLEDKEASEEIISKSARRLKSIASEELKWNTKEI